MLGEQNNDLGTDQPQDIAGMEPAGRRAVDLAGPKFTVRVCYPLRTVLAVPTVWRMGSCGGRHMICPSLAILMAEIPNDINIKSMISLEE